jgi:hypothetical protein
MKSEVIKKHKNKSQYILTPQGHWCRDFTKQVSPFDINSFVAKNDLRLFANNEIAIKAMNIANIDREFIRTPHVAIVSDGYKFEERKSLLKSLPRSTTIIGTNRSLVKWDTDLRMDYFVVNNPYKACMANFPAGDYLPRCIVSSRTSPDFVRRYRAARGVLYKYVPTKDKHYGGIHDAVYYIDDYRNPICAAIGLAYHWGVKKLMLFCCDDVFEGERPGATKLPNGLFMYPQHEISHGFMEGCLYWLQRQEYHPVKIVNYSQGPEYNGASYINEEGVKGFFR